MIFEGDHVRLKDTKGVPIPFRGKLGMVGSINEQTNKLHVVSEWRLMILDRKDVQEIAH